LLEAGTTVDADHDANHVGDDVRVGITVAGQSLRADTLVVQQTVTTSGARIISVGIKDLRLVLRAGTPAVGHENDPTDASVVAWIDGINGAFVMTQGGVAGQISITNKTFSLGGTVTLSFQSMTLLFNTGTSRVTQTFGSTPFVVDVPAGR